MKFGKISKFFGDKLKSFKAADVITENVLSVPPALENQNLGFGGLNTPRMLRVDYSDARGWETPRIEAFKPLQIHPFNSTLHYGICSFEGLKAYRGKNEELMLFRPMENCKRFLESNRRLSLPGFDPKELLSLIEHFVKLEKDWIPDIENGSLYIRPFSFSLTNKLGVHRATESSIMVVASPVGDYFSGEINLSVYEDYWRGSPKSAAAYKIGANYAPTIQIADDLNKKGISQAVWVYDDCLLESGATNLFFFIKSKDGKVELVTHPLDGCILPGITRDALLKLAPTIIPDIKVSERPFRIPEFQQCHKEGRLLEMFVSGTASVIGHVHSLDIRNHKYVLDSSNGSNFSSDLRKRLIDIQTGVHAHEYCLDRRHVHLEQVIVKHGEPQYGCKYNL